MRKSFWRWLRGRASKRRSKPIRSCRPMRRSTICAAARSSVRQCSCREPSAIGGSVPVLLRLLYLDRDMRQRAEPVEPPAVEVGAPRFSRDDRYDGAKMAGTEAPEMEIGEPVALGFDGAAQPFRQALIGVHVEQDRAGIADETIGPIGDDERADDTHDRVHERSEER